jgi:hypothetical protein
MTWPCRNGKNYHRFAITFCATDQVTFYNLFGFNISRVAVVLPKILIYL